MLQLAGQLFLVYARTPVESSVVYREGRKSKWGQNVVESLYTTGSAQCLPVGRLLLFVLLLLNNIGEIVERAEDSVCAAYTVSSGTS